MTETKTLSGTGELPGENGLRLISGLMRHFGESGDAVGALRWALPQVLEELKAEAGSLFMYRDEDAMLECVVCTGPVDITGLLVPAGEGLVGRSFTSGEAEIVSDAEGDGAHFNLSDARSGFRTVTTATAPVKLGDNCYGAIQAINRKDDKNPETILLFDETDLSLLVSLASALAMAITNVSLAENVIADQLLKRDLDQATEAQAALMPSLDPSGRIAGRVLPAQQLSGDFIDFHCVGSHMVFCQGDVTGKGITAALMMAQVISLFRVLSRQGHTTLSIARLLNQELVQSGSDRFVTLALGRFDTKTGEAELLNCGHGPVLRLDDSSSGVELIPSHTVPLGLVDLSDKTFDIWQGNLSHSALYMVTDGITEAVKDGAELRIEGIADMLHKHQGLSSAERVTGIMRGFLNGDITTHDDASLLVVTGSGQGGGTR